jgi:hypothetical protein
VRRLFAMAETEEDQEKAGISLESRHYLWLLPSAGVVAVVLVWAEEHQHWLTAQASLLTILLLIVVMVWGLWEANHKCPQLAGEADTYSRAIHKLLLCVAIGFTALVLNANRWDHWKYGGVARAIGYGTLVAGAFFIGGVLLGYLFGLRPTGASQNQSSIPPPLPPTNLEEIADWLTKLILGAGLVELTRLQGPIGQFAAFMARGVSPPTTQEDPGSPAIALAIMSFFSASGLLYGYLWTRYQQALKAAPDTSGTASSHRT